MLAYIVGPFLYVLEPSYPMLRAKYVLYTYIVLSVVTLPQRAMLSITKELFIVAVALLYTAAPKLPVVVDLRLLSNVQLLTYNVACGLKFL